MSSATATAAASRAIAVGHGRAAAQDSVFRSDAGGLCLLWPWLRTHLEAAAQRLPGHDPLDSRRLALAALLPVLPDAVDDAMVRLLAGDDLAREPSVIVVTEDELRSAGEGANAVLSAFAASIQGFGGSTPEFIRREFLERIGIIDPRTHPLTIRLAPKALDPLISRLPYPIGAFRLPWTGPIAVHIEAG